MKIAVIGEKDALLGFKPLGIKTYPVADAKEAEERLNTLARDGDYVTIYLTESFASRIKGAVAEVSKSSNIVIIPGRGEVLGLARERLKKITEKALGTDILSNEE